MPRINAVSFHNFPTIESICRTVQGAGFDSLELCRPLFFEQLTTEITRRKFAERASETGLSLFGFDCWVEVEPFEAYDETIAEFQAAIDWADDLDLGLIISHDPWNRVNGDRSAAECLKVTTDMFRRVADICLDKRLRLVLEPHPDTLSMDNSWAIDLVDAVGEGRPAGTIGLVYDCCHYGVGQPNTYVESIEKLGERIRHVHFSDGDRRSYALHLALGDGDLDLESIVAALKAIEFQGTLTNDLFNNPHLEQSARRNSSRVLQVERDLDLPSARPLPEARR